MPAARWPGPRRGAGRACGRAGGDAAAAILLPAPLRGLCRRHVVACFLRARGWAGGQLVCSSLVPAGARADASCRRDRRRRRASVSAVRLQRSPHHLKGPPVGGGSSPARSCIRGRTRATCSGETLAIWAENTACCHSRFIAHSIAQFESRRALRTCCRASAHCLEFVGSASRPLFVATGGAQGSMAVFGRGGGGRGGRCGRGLVRQRWCSGRLSVSAGPPAACTLLSGRQLPLTCSTSLHRHH